MSNAGFTMERELGGQVVIDFLKSWQAVKIPAPEILKIMTVNDYKVCELYAKQVLIKVGFPIH